MTDHTPVKLLIAAVLVVNAIVLLAWWLPQKWAACSVFYDNYPARLICVSS